MSSCQDQPAHVQTEASLAASRCILLFDSKSETICEPTNAAELTSVGLRADCSGATLGCQLGLLMLKRCMPTIPDCTEWPQKLLRDRYRWVCIPKGISRRKQPMSRPPQQEWPLEALSMQHLPPEGQRRTRPKWRGHCCRQVLASILRFWSRVQGVEFALQK